MSTSGLEIVTIRVLEQGRYYFRSTVGNAVARVVDVLEEELGKLLG